MAMMSRIFHSYFLPLQGHRESMRGRLGCPNCAHHHPLHVAEQRVPGTVFVCALCEHRGNLAVRASAKNHAKISVTTPEPTVLPPSRTANRNPWSIAIGAISSPVIVTLSPGITISTPAGNPTTPVTSVVRK